MFAIPWWIWAVLAAGLGLAELHAPGSYLIWIALGAGMTAAINVVWDLSISGQIGTFTVASVISCVGGYFVYRRLNRPKEDAPLNQRDLRMVGARGVVCQSLANGQGKVRLGDSVWMAEGPNLSEGTPIIVKSVRGTFVIVDATEPNKADETC